MTYDQKRFLPSPPQKEPCPDIPVDRQLPEGHYNQDIENISTWRFVERGATVQLVI